METALAFLCGLTAAASLYLMLSGNIIRFIFGLMLASNTVNLIIFTAGRIDSTNPPLIRGGPAIAGGAVANALPQALILTAIVIGFALLTFVFILFYRSFQSLGTVDTEKMRFAEPREETGAEPDAGRGRGSP